LKPLADYIFAKDRKGSVIAMTAPVGQAPREQIAMTAPVTQSSIGDSWTIFFNMPASCTMETLPTSVNPNVRLVDVGKRRPCRASDPCIVEGAIQAAEPLACGCDQRLDVRRAVHVRRHKEARATRGLDFAQHLLALVATPRGENDLGALGRRLPSRRRTESRMRARQ